LYYYKDTKNKLIVITEILLRFYLPNRFVIMTMNYILGYYYMLWIEPITSFKKLKNLKNQGTKMQYYNYHPQQNMIKDECNNLPRTKWLSNKVALTCC
jgi:hypothetical protein